MLFEAFFFSIQREVQALHRGFRHLIFNLPYSVTRNFLFFFSPLQDLCWALSIHTINLITPHKCRHQPGKMKRCFRVKKKKKKKLRFYFFDLPFYLPWDFYKQTVKSWKSNNGARMVLCCTHTDALEYVNTRAEILPRSAKKDLMTSLIRCTFRARFSRIVLATETKQKCCLTSEKQTNKQTSQPYTKG